MSAVQVLGDANTVLAFALGGVPGRVVRTAADARAAVTAILTAAHAPAEAGQAPTLLLVTSRVAELARDVLEPASLDAHGPLVLEIPGFGEAPGRDPVGDFVERVLGVHL